MPLKEKEYVGGEEEEEEEEDEEEEEEDKEDDEDDEDEEDEEEEAEADAEEMPDDDEEENDEGEDENEDKKNSSGNKNGGAKSIQKSDEDDSEEESEENDEDEEDDNDDDDDDGNNYLKKFDKELRKNYLLDFHPESIINNYSEIQFLIKVIKNDKDVIIDELHKTIPFLTKYEKTRVLGQRAKQINSGSAPFVEVDDNIMDGLLIAQKELHQKKIPFIIRRPIPNGGSEYWRLEDLQLID